MQSSRGRFESKSSTEESLESLLPRTETWLTWPLARSVFDIATAAGSGRASHCHPSCSHAAMHHLMASQRTSPASTVFRPPPPNMTLLNLSYRLDLQLEIGEQSGEVKMPYPAGGRGFMDACLQYAPP